MHIAAEMKYQVLSCDCIQFGIQVEFNADQSA